MENPAKRRKSFIDISRKSINFDKMFSEDKDISDKDSSLTVDQYLSSLKEERLQWKNILHLRMKQLENLKSICTNDIPEINPAEVEQFLSPDDRKFLNDEPNYLGMIESANKYLEAVDFFKRYKTDLIEHYDEVVEEIGIENDMLVNSLCQGNVCELCNQKNCKDADHYFPSSFS